MQELERALLSVKSKAEIETLAKKADLLEDLLEEKPTLDIAILCGVRDCSYTTVRYGKVYSYRGEAIVTMANGKRWLCIGKQPSGNVHWVHQNGFIQMIPLED